MKNIVYVVLSSVLIFSCDVRKEWVKETSIDLGDVTPIGVTYLNGNIWIADGDNNRILELSTTGEVINTYENFERPMHISAHEEAVYVPEYGSDKIIKLENNQRSVYPVADSLDAPAGIAMYQNEIAIADFYNHRIVYFDGVTWSTIGTKGKGEGEFYHPTDVQITADRIYIADAYNHRVQVFDKSGKFLQVIGEAEKMNAATGIFVSKEQIFVTDFENNRVLVYTLAGELIQVINDGLNKPTDILMIATDLYIVNYKGKSLNKYSFKKVS